MSEQIGQLRDLGFGEYEARAYLALLQTSPMNGYEVSKASGLPRANVYGVLQKLEDRGAVVRVDAPEGTRYAPVPSDEVVQPCAQPEMACARQASHPNTNTSLTSGAPPRSWNTPLPWSMPPANTWWWQRGRRNRRRWPTTWHAPRSAM